MEKPLCKTELNPYRVDVLDGIRALSILLVLWFHVWQQSWLAPLVRLPFSERIISLDCVPRAGFLFVDMLLLLSAFCLFLPHARAMVLGEPVPSVGVFYRKRLARIVPSYWFAVLVIFLCFSLPSGVYAGDEKGMWTDILSTMTFTQTFFPKILLGTRINGALWTAAVEMQFYLLFPFLAYCFRRKTTLTYVVMVSVSMAYLFFVALPDTEKLRYLLNQLPGFFGVFANGMLAAYVYVLLCKTTTRKLWLSIPATLVSLGCIVLIVRMLKSAPAVSPVQVWQASHRYYQSIVFALFVLSSALSLGAFRFLLSNRVMVFLASVSYNLYIWHQWLAVRLKEWHIPYWEGEQPPNLTGDAVWQRKYTWIVIGVSLAVAALVTLLVEKPLAKQINRIPVSRTARGMERD